MRSTLGHCAALLMLVPLVALAGCGSRVEDATIAARLGEVSGPAGTEVAAASGETPAAESAPQPGAAATQVAGATATASTPAPALIPGLAPAAETDGGPEPIQGIIESIEPLCVERPGVTKVTIKTVPFADVTFAAAFSDNYHYDQWGIGVADATGRYVWTLTVKPEVPPGNAIVIAGARRYREGGPGQGGFRVADPGGCS